MDLERYESRIESKFEVQSFLDKLRYALEHNATIRIQVDRDVERTRDIRFSNRYTLAELFPEEAPEEALRRELHKLTVKDYIETQKDARYPMRGEFRVFGVTYPPTQDVFIRIRVELFANFGQHSAYVMSFHFATRPFAEEHFPYCMEEKT